MSPRPDVSEERQQQILEAATSVFARRGFHEARMDDIAQEAGLSKGALYLYYKSKDAIIAALLKFCFNVEMKQLRTFLEQKTGLMVREQMVTFTRQFAADMKWMPFILPVSFEFYALAGRRKDVRQNLKEYFKEYRELMAALIQRGIDNGEFRAVDAQSAAIITAALFEGMTLLWMVDPQAMNIEQEAERCMQMLLDGLNKHAVA